jgi:primosomal protein N' (replication factor Y) (superfamily II helicase)
VAPDADIVADRPPPLVVRVLPDVAGMGEKTFDYLVPDGLRDQVRVGTKVRVVLGAGRRVGGWVVGVGVEPPAGVRLRPLAKLSGWGPSAEVIDLGRWAAHRWFGPLVHLLDTASPPGAVRSLPPLRPCPAPGVAAGAGRPGGRPHDGTAGDGDGGTGGDGRPAGRASSAGGAAGDGDGGDGRPVAGGSAMGAAGEVPGGHVGRMSGAGGAAGAGMAGAASGGDGGGATGQGAGVVGELGRLLAGGGPGVLVRCPPAADLFPVVLAVGRSVPIGADIVVVAPSVELARSLAGRVRAAGGGETALLPREWGRAAAGGGVVTFGARAAVWAPAPSLGAVVVLDEHDEALQEERMPTWHARAVALERARRAGVPCVLVSPCPSLEALAWAEAAGAAVLTPSTGEERRGWPVLDVVDRRNEDPRAGFYSERLAGLLRDRHRGRVVCVLNRTGRARLLACAACGELARCEHCDGALRQDAPGQLVCGRCGQARPPVCAACGSGRLKLLRLGVERVREELEALAGEPVGEVTAANAAEGDPGCRLVVGTEAVLHLLGAGPDNRREPVGVMAFLDFDQELLAPRFRAVEQAMTLLVRGARLLGERDAGGRMLVQTRLPRHALLDAVLHASPQRVAAAERPTRQALGFPPFGALAAVSGPAAPAFMAELGQPAGLEVLGPSEGRWLVRAPDPGALADALAGVPRPPGRLRVEVDPHRV